MAPYAGRDQCRAIPSTCPSGEEKEQYVPSPNRFECFLVLRPFIIYACWEALTLSIIPIAHVHGLPSPPGSLLKYSHPITPPNPL